MSPRPKFELAIKGADKVFAVDGRASIGTAPGSTVRLKSDGQIEPLHALVEQREGALFVQATGVTLVNGVAVTSAELSLGSVLRIGRLELQVRLAASRGEVVTQPEGLDPTVRSPVLSGTRPPPSNQAARASGPNPVMQANAPRASGAVPAADRGGAAAAGRSGAVPAVGAAPAGRSGAVPAVGGAAAGRSGASPGAAAAGRSGAIPAAPGGAAGRSGAVPTVSGGAAAARRSGAVPAVPGAAGSAGAIPAAPAAAARSSGAVPAVSGGGPAARRSGAVPAVSGAGAAARSGAVATVPGAAGASGAAPAARRSGAVAAVPGAAGASSAAAGVPGAQAARRSGAVSAVPESRAAAAASDVTPALPVPAARRSGAIFALGGGAPAAPVSGAMKAAPTGAEALGSGPVLGGEDDGHGHTMVRQSGVGQPQPEAPTPFSGEEDFDASAVEPTTMRPMPTRPGPLQAGDVIGGRYEIVAHLAEGGMGEVYRATHVELGRVFAVKVMKHELSQDPEFVERFKREAVASSRIGQQNIVDISDFGRTDSGRFYFVMEFLDGPTLAQLIQRERVLYASRAVGILVQIARALAAAHEAGIVHRDLKPENVIILQRAGQKDFVKVVDFGVAKVADATGTGAQTALGVVVGTPQYMSPEQASGLPVDARSDIYSLGLIAWELIAGRAVFAADSVIGVMMAHMKTPAPPLVPGLADSFVPPELAAIIMRMLEKERDARPQSMLEVVEVFEQFLFGALKAGPAPVVPMGERASGAFASPGPPAAAVSPELPVAPVPAPARPRWPLFAVGGAVLVLLVGLIFAATRPRAQPQPPVETPPPVVVRPPEPVKLEPVKPPPAPTTVVLKIVTSPDKAEVFDGDILMGATPFEAQWPRGKLLKLRVTKDGFLEDTRNLSPEADLQLEFELKRKPVAPKPKPKPNLDDLSDSPY